MIAAVLLLAVLCGLLLWLLRHEAAMKELYWRDLLAASERLRHSEVALAHRTGQLTQLADTVRCVIDPATDRVIPRAFGARKMASRLASQAKAGQHGEFVSVQR